MPAAMRGIRYLDRDGYACFGLEAAVDRVVSATTRDFPPREFAGEPGVPSKRLPPIAPPNIMAIGRNYREHAAEMKATSQESEPLIFLKATSSVIGPHDPIVLPTSAPSEVDFEAELGAVIGHVAKDVPSNRALEYVFGYTCANDVSARDCQKRRDKQ